MGTFHFSLIYLRVYFSSQWVSLISLFSFTDPGKSTRYILLVGTVFYYPIINVIRSWSPVSRQPPISSSVINSSLSIIIRSKIELPHVRCHPFCVRKLSYIIFRDATDVLLLPAGGLQHSPPTITSCRKGQVFFWHPTDRCTQHGIWWHVPARKQPFPAMMLVNTLHLARVTAYQNSENCHFLSFTAR